MCTRFVGTRPVVLALFVVVVVFRSAVPAVATPGATLWARRYDGPGNGYDDPQAVAVSPNGTKVYVTGRSNGGSTNQDYSTLAYTSTGVPLWTRRYNGPGNGDDEASGVAVSPDGSKVFVTGRSEEAFFGYADFATVAYNAATGATLWAQRYNGSGGEDGASSVSVSPDGTRVFVTGHSSGTTSGEDYATVAYNATTGATLWTKRHNGPGNMEDVARAVSVSPDGTRVFVTGHSKSAVNRRDYATLAYNAATGATLWYKRYAGPGSGADNGDDFATGVSVSPDGTKVFVTGYGPPMWGGYNDYATVAYNATTGATLWTTRYDGPASGPDFANSLSVSPDGMKVFVTGRSTGTTSLEDYATVAYSATTGATLWTRRYNGLGNAMDFASAVSVSSDGTKVFVTGGSVSATSYYDYATITYSAVTGATLWTKRSSGMFYGYDGATAVAVSPDGTKVFVTGDGQSTYGAPYDYWTIAYSAV